VRTLFFLLTFLLASSSFANNPGVSYQGRIFKPDGTALEGTAVQFRMQVRSPGSENCLLYEEVQTLNMAGSAGVFSLTMNDGTGTRLDSPTYQVDRIFANRGTMTLDTSRCATGTDYTPNSSDGRKLVVYFKDETMAAYEAMPIMNLNYVPQSMYALESQKVGTFAVTNLLRAVDGSGNPAAAPALDPTQLTNLTNLLAGTSPQYATAAQFSTIQTFATTAPPTCGPSEVLKSNGTVLSCVTDSAGGAPAYSAITAASAANTIDNTNFAQTWNWSTATTQSPMSMSANALTTGSAMNVTTSSASLNSTNGLLNVANTGASTNGILARFQSNSTAGSGLTVLTNGNVGIGTSTPSGKLHVYKDGSGSDIVNTAVSSATNWDAGSFVGTRARGTTTTPSYPLSNDRIAAFASSNGVNPNAWSFMGMFATENWTAGAQGTAIRFYTIPNGSTTSFPRLSIDQTGNVGIGTTSPLTGNLFGPEFRVLGVAGAPPSSAFTQAPGVLNLAGTRSTAAAGDYLGQIRFSSLNNGAISGTAAGVFGELQGSGGANGFGGLLLFMTKADNGTLTEKMRIGSSGNVGIGTTTPQDKLSVNGNIQVAKNSSQPYACDAAHDAVIALTSQYTTCVCKGGSATWVRTTDGSTACTW